MLTSLALFPQLQELPTECIYAFSVIPPNVKWYIYIYIYISVSKVLLLIEVHVINTSKLLYTIIMGPDKG